jgi:hypothetical protein
MKTLAASWGRCWVSPDRTALSEIGMVLCRERDQVPQAQQFEEHRVAARPSRSPRVTARGYPLSQALNESG